MENYDHSSSPIIEKIEARFITEYEKKYVIPRLHNLYEKVRYHFRTADYVYMAMRNERLHYEDITNVLSEDEFTEWYNEMLRINPPIVEVGMPCTIYYYTDHRAATVTMVEYYKDGRTDAAGNRIPCRIGTNLNRTTCKDYYAGDYDVIPMDEYEINIIHDVFTLRKNGHWIMEGQPLKDGCSLEPGYWSHYIDPSF